MSQFLIKVSWYQPYPKEADYRIEATSLPTATARALRTWKKSIGRKKAENITVKIMKA